MTHEPTQSFRETIYEIYQPPVILRVGEVSEGLDALLAQHGEETWAFITPYNPHPEVLSDAENIVRLHELGEMVAEYITYSGEGHGSEAHPCPAEKGYYILGITLDEAKHIGDHFGQKAILAGTRGEVVKLVNLR